MVKRNTDRLGVKVFLSHRYKSPEVNLYFFDLLSAQTDVQFEVDVGTNATNVTRLERMIRDADAFVGLYPYPQKFDSPVTYADLRAASRYFRLEIDIALRMRKPMLVFFDRRYEDVLCLPRGCIGLSFDIQEIAGSGASPRRMDYQNAIRAFFEIVSAFQKLASLRTVDREVAQVGLLLPTGGSARAYKSRELAEISKVAQDQQVSSLSPCPGELVIDARMYRWLASLDWLITDVGELATRTGLPGFLHGMGIPMLRMCKGAKDEREAERGVSFRSLFGNLEVGYRKDIVFWDSSTPLAGQLASRIQRIREPVRRIGTLQEARSYFNSASLRNEAVFVSYSGRDVDFGRAIADALKKRFQVVFDYRDGESIVAGRPWLQEIFDKLAKSALGVPLLSPTYIDSGNCQHELAEMVAKQDMKQMKVIAVKLGDEKTELPVFLQATQYVRYREYPSVEALVDRIVASYDADRAPVTGV
jgi:hypothetical protein